MNRILRVTLALLTFALFPSISQDSHSDSLYKGRILVRLSPSGQLMTKDVAGRTGRPAFDALTTAQGLDAIRPLMAVARLDNSRFDLARKHRVSDWVTITVPTGQDPDALLAELTACPDVEVAEFDARVHMASPVVTPNDPYFATHQYSLHNTGTQPPYDPGTAGADIEMEAGWEHTTGDAATIVATIDTGIDFAHPEFSGRIWINVDEGSDGFDYDGNGYADDQFGYDFANNDAFPQDDNLHGSHVAGIIAATGNNGVGIAGMNWNCKIMPLKVLDATGSGFLTDVTEGILYAVNNGAHIMNLSIGGPHAQAEEDAINFALAAGVIVVAAMGNDDTDVPSYPAAYNGVISVGAVDSRDQRAFGPLCPNTVVGSNYGPWIDVCAAGDVVWSTVPTTMGSYDIFCLTSMASPHVAGLASLVLALRPDYPADSVARLIRLGSEDMVGRPEEDTEGFDVYHGWGRINARITLQALALDFPPILDDPGAQSVTEGDTLKLTLTASDSNFTPPALSVVTAPANVSLSDNGDGSADFEFTPLAGQVGSHTVTVTASDGTFADTVSFSVDVLPSCGCNCFGDPQCDAVTNVLDVVHAVNVAFKGGADIPDSNPSCPNTTTDVDCSGFTNVLDVVKFVNVAFKGQSAAAQFCDPCL